MIDVLGQLGFTGNFDMSVDSKGRVTVPAPFVRVIESAHADEDNQLVLTISPERSVMVMPPSRWLAKMDELEKLPDLDANSRTVRRLMTAHSFPVQLDSNNRIRLHPQLMKDCGIDKEVTIIGERRHFEIWDRESWRKYSEESLENYAQKAQGALRD